MSRLHAIHIGRVYDAVQEREGARVLVDRLWPRGMRKEDPRAGTWLKDVAPSTELRHWYAHDPARYERFAERYRLELAEPPAAEALAELRSMATKRKLLLVTATRDVDLSHLSILAEALHQPADAVVCVSSCAMAVTVVGFGRVQLHRTSGR